MAVAVITLVGYVREELRLSPVGLVVCCLDVFYEGLRDLLLDGTNDKKRNRSIL